MTFVEASLAFDGQQGKEKLLTDILGIKIFFLKVKKIDNNFKPNLPHRFTPSRARCTKTIFFYKK